MLYSSVALSIILSFISTEFVGVLTGGMISAGYLAYYFNSPTRIISTLFVAILITLAIKVLKNFLILYGRRRFMLSVLLSIFFVYIFQKMYFYLSAFDVDLRIIGYIIPGLIANDMEKQGIVKTILSLLAISSIIYLLTLFIKWKKDFLLDLHLLFF